MSSSQLKHHKGSRPSLHLACLTHNGPVIHNALPKKIRDLTGCSVDKFKRELDNFLRMLPDESPVPGYTANYSSASNSVSDQLRLRHQDLRDGSSDEEHPLNSTK